MPLTELVNPRRAPMPRSLRLREPGRLTLACVVLLAIPFFVHPQFDPDFWWHVLVGDRILGGNFPRTDPFTFTAQGHPFVVHEWASETLYSLLMHAGMWAVITVMAVVTAVGFFVAVQRARRYTSSDGMTAVCTALGLAVGITVFGPRPQMFTFAFAAILLWLLDRHREGGGKEVWLLVPLFAVWGNLHGGFTLGLGLFAVVIVVECMQQILQLEGRSRGRSRLLLAVFAASCAGILVNPNGLSVFGYAAGLLSNPVAQKYLDEWQSPNFHTPDSLPLLALIALLVIVGGRARRVATTDVILAGAGIVLALYAVRNLSIAVITSLPLLVAGAEGWKEAIGRRPRRRPRTHLAAPFVAVVLVGVTAGSAVLTFSRYSDPRNDDRSSAYPVAVADALCGAPRTNVFQPYGSAGWLLYQMERSAPRPCTRDPVFIWGEVNVIGAEISQAYVDAAAGKSNALMLLDRYGVETVWQGRSSPLTERLRDQPGWTCVFADARDVIYTRTRGTAGWSASRRLCP